MFFNEFLDSQEALTLPCDFFLHRLFSLEFHYELSAQIYRLLHQCLNNLWPVNTIVTFDSLQASMTS